MPPILATAVPTGRVAAKVHAAAVESLSPRSRFSADFSSWLGSRGRSAHRFAQGTHSAFGGRARPGEPVRRQPVIFVHGNSDQASGWNASYRAFREAGYQPAELYGFTWGPANPLLASRQTHSRAYLTELRAFIEAVLEYTGAKKVDLISHSMGVTLARKAIKGGEGRALDGRYDLGPPLTSRVDAFIGIAGANRGLTSAFFAPAVPTANAVDGFFPGVWTPLGVTGRSRYLESLNRDSTREGQRVYSIWSPNDELVNLGAPAGQGLVYGAPTSRIPRQDGEVVLPGMKHMALRDKTAAEQLRLVTGS